MPAVNDKPTGVEISAAFHAMMESHGDMSNVCFAFLSEREMLNHLWWDFQAENKGLIDYTDEQIETAVQDYVEKIGLHEAWLAWLPPIVADRLDSRRARHETANEGTETDDTQGGAGGDAESVEAEAEASVEPDEADTPVDAASIAEPVKVDIRGEVPASIKEGSAAVDLQTNENWWDKMPPLPIEPVMDLAQQIKSNPRTYDNVFEAIHDLYVVCFVAKSMVILENTNEQFAEYDYADVANAIDAYVEKEHLPNHWRHQLFEPACAAVRAIKAGKTPWYRPAPEEDTSG